MFGNCESSINFESNNSGESDNDSSFPSIFLGNITIMAIPNPEPKDEGSWACLHHRQPYSFLWQQLIFLLLAMKNMLF